MDDELDELADAVAEEIVGEIARRFKEIPPTPAPVFNVPSPTVNVTVPTAEAPVINVATQAPNVNVSAAQIDLSPLAAILKEFAATVLKHSEASDAKLDKLFEALTAPKELIMEDGKPVGVRTKGTKSK